MINLNTQYRIHIPEFYGINQKRILFITLSYTSFSVITYFIILGNFLLN